MALVRRSLLSGMLFAQRHLTVSLEIPSKDRSYQWVLQWISRQGKARAQRMPQHLGIETTFKQNQTSGHVSTHFDFVPSPGRHFLWYGRNFIQVVREREKSMIDLNSGTPWETVTLTTLGRSRAVFEQLLRQARDEALQKEEGRTVIYTSMGPEWRQFGRPRKRRPLHSVILDADISKRIKHDIEDFTRTAAWYVDRGIPYRRGYLLHGAPGCGKSSFIMALAGELKYNICILNLNERGLTDDKLNVLMSVAPPRSFILLEDIDAAFNKREGAADNYSVTFSGLLNCLDGVASTEERIVFMTTNHLEKLDKALIRPGRVDLLEEIGLATGTQMQQMFARFYPDSTPELAREFAERLVAADAQLSMAEIQGFFMFFKNDAHAVLKNLNQLLKSPQSVLTTQE
jgi:chaperone BCS1